MRVYVVGWHPAPGSGANGGFEWRYDRGEAFRELIVRIFDEARRDDKPRHNIVFCELEVPFERVFPGGAELITSWIDANINLIELPEQTVIPTRKFRWYGWTDGEDSCDPPEPGKEWITIEDSDGNEQAVIVLRRDAFEGRPQGLDAARRQREMRADFIVEALNRMEEDNAFVEVLNRMEEDNA